jgi:D-glycero-D-manno-heptose 1,7-bisphosphate phosphatase
VKVKLPDYRPGHPGFSRESQEGLFDLVMRAVFIDRDGVICQNKHDHVKSWTEFHFLPGVKAALAELSRSHLLIVVITNQAIINREIVDAETVDGIHRRMIAEVKTSGGRIDRVMLCPHRPDEGCGCRKPQIGLLLRASQEMDIDLADSYLIGDAWSDIRAGQAVECTCFLVLTGRGLRQLTQYLIHARGKMRVALNLSWAVRAILRAEEARVSERGGPSLALSEN